MIVRGKETAYPSRSCRDRGHDDLPAGTNTFARSLIAASIGYGL